jgi:putative membrane protein
MNTPIDTKPTADLRDYLAEERTFLAWIRTGIALMGFGFVLAHFGLSEDQPELAQVVSIIQPDTLSRWLGIALIGVGVGVNLISARRYMRLVGALNRGQFIERAVSKQGVALAMFLALLGTAATFYMLAVLGSPSAALQAYPPAPIGDSYGSFKDAVLRL